MTPIAVRVASVRDETPEIRSLRLIATDGGVLAQFEPGSHIRLFGRRTDGSAAKRAYSLVSASGLDHYEIGVLREGRGGVSDWIHGLRAGAALAIEPPRNDFPLAPHALEHLLIAGGIGITPLLAMARHLAHGQRPFRLWMLVKSLAQVPFTGPLAALPPRALAVHQSRDGRVNLGTVLAGHHPGRHVYVCGPKRLTDSICAAANGLHIPPRLVHVERFSNLSGASADRPFDVEFRASGLKLRIEAGETILARALEAGIFPGYDCEHGECGACLTRVLEGVPEHRDAVQTEAEKAANAFMTICCSRARTGSLVLDL